LSPALAEKRIIDLERGVDRPPDEHYPIASFK
jgi:hypothetical protein